MGQEWNLNVEGGNLTGEAETAVLVAIITLDEPEQIVEEHLDELEFLALTAGAKTRKRFTQKRDTPDARSYIGSGKLKEIAEYIKKHEIDLLIFDDDLSASQVNNVEKVTKIKAIDRSTLILDIFAKRAKTAQAKTQVELAQMQYLLPRLRGMWTHLARQRGGIGMRGPGEKEIETDRRIVRDRISRLKDDLEKIEKQNATRRKNRGQLIRAALVGYTNVGKSTLMNILSKADVFAEDKLFATLDTTVRKVVLGRTPFLLSDTVGFIRKLPTHLIESFNSTLNEVEENDILLHVIDISHPQYEDHIDTVDKTLRDLNAADKTIIYVFNKIDLYRERYFDKYLDEETQLSMEQELKETLKNRYGENTILCSAVTKENIPELRDLLKEKVMQNYKERYPYKTQLWS